MAPGPGFPHMIGDRSGRLARTPRERPVAPIAGLVHSFASGIIGVAIVAWVVLPARAQPVTSRPADSANELATQRVRAWALQLGDPDFRRRERAQEALAALGESAWPAMFEFLDHPDAEISRRVAELLPVPSSPHDRAALAVRLIETGRRECLRHAVFVLFDDPGRTHEPFRDAVAGRTGLVAEVAAPILEELETWNRHEQVLRRQTTQKADSNPAGVARLRALQEQNVPFRGEAAFWMALEARDNYLARTTGPPSTTRPADAQR